MVDQPHCFRQIISLELNSNNTLCTTIQWRPLRPWSRFWFLVERRTAEGLFNSHWASQVTAIARYFSHKACNLRKFKLKNLATTATLNVNWKCFSIMIILWIEKYGVKVSYFFKNHEEKCGNEQNDPLKIYLQFIWKRSYRFFCLQVAGLQ